MSFDKAAFLIRQVSLEYGVPVEKITGKTRTQTVVEARKEAIKRIKAQTALSWAEINETIGRAKGCHRI